MVVQVIQEGENSFSMINSDGVKIHLQDSAIMRKFLKTRDETIGAMETLAEARSRVRQSLKKGKEAITCPCCNQNSKKYKRTITKNMAKLLRHFYYKYRFETFHLEDEARLFGWSMSFRTGFPLLRHWGLIDKIEGKNPDTGSNHRGEYRLTLKGSQFCRGEITVFQFMWTYADTGFKPHGDQVIIAQCYNKKWTFAEMMNRDTEDYPEQQ